MAAGSAAAASAVAEWLPDLYAAAPRTCRIHQESSGNRFFSRRDPAGHGTEVWRNLALPARSGFASGKSSGGGPADRQPAHVSARADEISKGLREISEVSHRFQRTVPRPGTDREQEHNEISLNNRPSVLICYCFGHTVESARNEIVCTGKSTLVQNITKEIQAGNCACEIKNPSGRCCLGEVNKTVRAIFAQLGMVPVSRS